VVVFQRKFFKHIIGAIIKYHRLWFSPKISTPIGAKINTAFCFTEYSDSYFKHLEFEVIEDMLLMFEIFLLTPVLEHQDALFVGVRREIFHTSTSRQMLRFQLSELLLLVFEPSLNLAIENR